MEREPFEVRCSPHRRAAEAEPIELLSDRTNFVLFETSDPVFARGFWVVAALSYLALATKREKAPQKLRKRKIIQDRSLATSLDQPTPRDQTIGDAQAVVWSEKQNLMPIVDIHVVADFSPLSRNSLSSPNVTDAVVAIEERAHTRAHAGQDQQVCKP